MGELKMECKPSELNCRVKGLGKKGTNLSNLGKECFGWYEVKDKKNCTQVLYSPEKAMAPHSSTLAWKIPWTEEPGGLQSMGSLGVGHY